MTDQELLDLQARNQARVSQAIANLGTKYLCHPANQITKKKFKKELIHSKKLKLNT